MAIVSTQYTFLKFVPMYFRFLAISWRFCVFHSEKPYNKVFWLTWFHPTHSCFPCSSWGKYFSLVLDLVSHDFLKKYNCFYNFEIKFFTVKILYSVSWQGVHTVAVCVGSFCLFSWQCMLDLPPLINQLTPPFGDVFFKCILGCYLLLLCHEVLGVLVTYLRVLPAVSASPQSVVNAVFPLSLCPSV